MAGATFQCLLQGVQTDLGHELDGHLKDAVLALPGQGHLQLHLAAREAMINSQSENDVWAQGRIQDFGKGGGMGQC